jgi:hypothetical protein
VNAIWITEVWDTKEPRRVVVAARGEEAIAKARR